MMTRQMTSWILLGIFVLLSVASMTPATAVTVTAQYLKTLGQTNADGQFPFLTSGGRIAVGEDGSIYLGSPVGYNPYLQRISADGKILWQIAVFGCGLQATAVDGSYLYTGGRGYYGHSFLQRRLRETGQPAPGWQYDWDLNKKENNKPPADKVEAPRKPSALLLDDRYIFLADADGNEIRRFLKESGAEAPFPTRLMVVKPLDLAFSSAGTLLILTEEAVIEVDKGSGRPLRVPVVADLRTPVALDVSRKTGAIYIAEAGDNAEVINRIRMYTPEGKPLNVEIGIGGDFNGKWYPLAFAFSSGGGDFTLDANGGLWVNAFGHRMDYCPIISHLGPGPRFLPDLTLRGVMGTGLFVDPNLDVYVGGSYKIGWDDRLKWTSGLINPGPADLFPTTLDGWMMNPAWSDGATAVIAAVHHNFFYRVNAKNGALLGKTVPGGGQYITGTCTVGRDIYYSVPGRTIYKTTADLAPPQAFMALPDGVTVNQGPIAVSPDLQYIAVPAIIDAGKPGQYAGILCFRKDGTQAWSGKGGAMALRAGVLFTSNPDGAGVAAVEMATGKRIALFGDKEENGRPPINGILSMTVTGKDGADYLFIHSNARILVYRVSIG